MQLRIKDLTRFRTQPTGGFEVRYNCPHCGDLNGRLYANFKKRLWVCFHCGARGNVREHDALAGPDVTVPRFREETVREFSWSTYPDIRGSGLTYLNDHHVDPAVALAFGVRSGKDTAAHRLVIPVKRAERSGYKTVFRVAHATSSIMRPKEYQSGKRTPWTLSYVFWPPLAVLVEGAADALRLASALKFHSTEDTRPDGHKLHQRVAIVALWGKFLSEENAFFVAERHRDFYVMLDKEKDGLSREGEKLAAIELTYQLATICRGVATHHRWPWHTSANDPAEMPYAEAIAALEHAVRATA